MANLSFRDLRADEIDCRIATVKENGISLLLYKDARCDMNILDETVGAYNWQRSHSRDNANCIVSIWDDTKKQWISKEDTGTESNTEAAKGLASDSFKRACFNWGIGRELYTAPFIWIDKSLISSKYDKFVVKDIVIKDKKIVALTIANLTTKKIVYTFGKTSAKQEPANQEQPRKTEQQPEQPQSFRVQLREFCTVNKIDTAPIIKKFKLSEKSTEEDYKKALDYVLIRQIKDETGGLPFEITEE